MPNPLNLTDIDYPKPPTHLSRAAKRWWRQLVKDYGITDSAGILLLREALSAWDMANSARLEVERDGLTVPAADGSIKKHPALLVEKESRSQFLSAFKSLHLDTAPQPPTKKD